jgi:hypothetical protein
MMMRLGRTGVAFVRAAKRFAERYVSAINVKCLLYPFAAVIHHTSPPCVVLALKMREQFPWRAGFAGPIPTEVRNENENER